MDGEWDRLPLSALTVNHDSKRFPVKEADRKSGPYPYYGASGIVDYIDDYIFDGEYLLIAEDGENLRTRKTPVAFLASGKFWVNNHAHIVTGNERAITPFIHYALQSADISRYLTGAVMPKLTQRSLNQIEISAPHLDEQERIVDLLGALDDKIDLNCRLAATLEKIARALFQSWFVDYEPVYAKAAGRDPGLPGDIAALFPNSFGDEGLPQGWSVDRVGSLFDVVGGNTPSTAQERFWNGAHPWATPKDMSAMASPILTTTGRRLTSDGLNAVSSGLVPKGSLLLSSRAPIGYLAFAGMPMAINQGIAAFVEKDVSTIYAWAWCLAHMDSIKSAANGSTFQEISKGTLRQLPMLRPSHEVLDAFSSVASISFARIMDIGVQTHALAELRGLLLPKLVSGELRIPIAAAEVAAA